MWLELINHRLSIDETIYFVQGLGLWLQDTADDMFVALSTKEIRQRWSSADHSANSGHARRHGRQTSCFQRFASLDRKLRGTNFPHVPFSLFLSKKFYYSQGLLDRWQTVWRPVQNHSRRFRPGTWQTLPRHRTAFRPIWQSCHDGWWSRCVLQRHFRHMHDTNQSQLSLGAGTLICLAKIRRNDAIVPFFSQDPHYCGTNATALKLQKKGYIQWVRLQDFLHNSFYNLCLPQFRPTWTWKSGNT